MTVASLQLDAVIIPLQENRSMPPTLPTFDATYEPLVWRCHECRRVLGVVMRVLGVVMPGTKGKHIRRLWVFSTDRAEDEVPPTAELRRLAPGLFKVHGVDSCSGVECSRCGAINAWSMSREAYLQLISYFQS